MNPHICRCCGEPIAETGNTLSRNPNVCASCSSMADGMETSNLPADTGHESQGARLAETAEHAHPSGMDHEALEPTHHTAGVP
jgi:hypothetical protein